MVSSKYLLFVNCCNNASDLALYTEMKEGMLAPETDYASRPLREHLKRKEKYIILSTFLPYTFLRGCSESKSSVSASTRECL